MAMSAIGGSPDSKAQKSDASMRKKYYLILRLAPGATSEQVRSAYRRRALELHPDLTGFGSEQFLDLQEAYEVLSDPVRREIYDREGEEIPIRRSAVTHPQQTVSAEPLVPSRPTGELDRISLFRSFETFSPSLEEVFERLWSNFNVQTRPKAERLESLNVEVPLSPEQAFVGGEVRILVPARLVCQACRGRGSIGTYECTHCEGHGAVTDEYPVTVRYPRGLRGDHLVHLPLHSFGIQNLYLTVVFRPRFRSGED
jgi:molecular chaperone DnaJ